MKFDNAGLGFSKRNGNVYVSFPRRDKSGAITYGMGTQVEFPAHYFETPPNDITKERCQIINTLEEERVMASEDVLTITYVCPVTMKAVEVTIRDNVEIAGYCENDELPKAHYILVSCDECDSHHKLS